jgi:hypothetical protein
MLWRTGNGIPSSVLSGSDSALEVSGVTKRGSPNAHECLVALSVYRHKAMADFRTRRMLYSTAERGA